MRLVMDTEMRDWVEREAYKRHSNMTQVVKDAVVQAMLRSIMESVPQLSFMGITPPPELTPFMGITPAPKLASPKIGQPSGLKPPDIPFPSIGTSPMLKPPAISMSLNPGSSVEAPFLPLPSDKGSGSEQTE